MIVRFIKLSVQTFQPLMERVGRMPLPINRHAQVGLPDKGRANKGLVVCWMTQFTFPGYTVTNASYSPREKIFKTFHFRTLTTVNTKF